MSQEQIRMPQICALQFGRDEMNLDQLFSSDLKVVNVGSPIFNPDYEFQHVEYTHLDWRPVANGNPVMIAVLKKLRPFQKRIDAANQIALERILAAEAYLVDIASAKDVIPGMGKRMILHAGPPIKYETMAGPMRGAVLGAIIYERWASTLEEADLLARSGTISFEPAHQHAAVGPMAGIISPSMPVHVLHNPVHQSYAYCTVNEGLGKVLRYGANSAEVIERLRWIESQFAPVLKATLQVSGPIDIKGMIAQALHMGDEGHNRNKASTSLFFREIAPYVLQTSFPVKQQQEFLEFIKANDHYMLNLSMPYAKLAMDTIQDVKDSSVVSVMSRNGVEFGIQVAGSKQWFTAPANYVEGLLFPGFTKEDAAPDIGDSSITETAGIGGFALAGAPAIIQFVGGSVKEAFQYSKDMHQITVGKHIMFTIPNLDFQATALGINILDVVEKNVLPIINTGMAHKDPGVGQVGAGLVHPPLACFEAALIQLLKQLEASG